MQKRGPETRQLMDAKLRNWLLNFRLETPLFSFDMVVEVKKKAISEAFWVTFIKLCGIMWHYTAKFQP